VSRGFCVATILSLVGAGGCAPRSTYVVTPVVADHVEGELDGAWFSRDVYDESARVRDVELVYCPVVPKEGLVCRTSLVYRIGVSELLNSR